MNLFEMCHNYHHTSENCMISSMAVLVQRQRHSVPCFILTQPKECPEGRFAKRCRKSWGYSQRSVSITEQENEGSCNSVESLRLVAESNQAKYKENLGVT